MKRTLKIIANTLLWLFVAFAVLITVLVFSAQSNRDGLPTVFGKSIVTVTTDSMSPTLKSGDMIIDNSLTTEEKTTLKTGDVITYYTDLNGDGNDEINTHRIVSRYDEGGYTYYVTKGDNEKTNPINDKDPVPSNKILAQWSGTRLRGIGSVIAFLQTSVGFLCVIVIPLVLFFLFELYNFIAVIIKAKSKSSVSAEQEEEIKKRAIEEYLKQSGQPTGEAPEEKPEETETAENK